LNCAEVRSILVVDDESSLLGLLEYYLKRLAYDVVAVSDPHEAWTRFCAEPGRFGLVVMDLNLPGISGEELSSRMLGLNPALRLLISSGYPFDASRLPLARCGQAEFLQKPYTPNMLVATVQRMFSPPGAAADSRCDPDPSSKILF
jgi:two-component system, cell cycle sensor histidine kinase and response regulator CckA